MRVEPARNTVFILQSRDLPQSVDTEMDWDDYLERYSRILTSSGRERLFGEFSARALLRRGAGGEGHFSLDLPYLKGAATNWVTVAAVFGRREGGELYADLFVRQSNEEHMLRSIIEFYNGGPVGLETLAATINEEAVTLEDVYEPYLLQQGYLTRTPRGRCVTRKAYEHLGLEYHGQEQLEL